LTCGQGSASGQLVERVGWAVLDADQLEHKEDRAAPL
jgi:hypothetical protein